MFKTALVARDRALVPSSPSSIVVSRRGQNPLASLLIGSTKADFAKFLVILY